jgi:hypothetical protein
LVPWLFQVDESMIVILPPTIDPGTFLIALVFAIILYVMIEGYNSGNE